jgi:hypothetical protein
MPDNTHALHTGIAPDHPVVLLLLSGHHPDRRRFDVAMSGMEPATSPDLGVFRVFPKILNYNYFLS